VAGRGLRAHGTQLRKDPIVNAVDAFLAECRADPRYAADAPTIAEALEALYLEGDDSADAITLMDAVTWVLKQPRTLDERFEVLGRLLSLNGKITVDLREFTGWTS
jgi:hypothetical protein